MPARLAKIPYSAQMYRKLSSKGIVVPDGFALTTEAYYALHRNAISSNLSQ